MSTERILQLVDELRGAQIDPEKFRQWAHAEYTKQRNRERAMLAYENRPRCNRCNKVISKEVEERTGCLCEFCHDLIRCASAMPEFIEHDKYNNFHAILRTIRDYEGGDPDGILSEM